MRRMSTETAILHASTQIFALIVFVCFKVAFYIFNNGSGGGGFRFICVGFPQVFDDFAEVRLYDILEKLVFVHITGIQLPLGKFFLISKGYCKWRSG